MLGHEVRAVLGRRLHDLYRPEPMDEPAEPMPARILDLLDRLAAAMPPAVPEADRAAPEVASPPA